ncbi:hypothetical protein [Rhizobium sp.]|uniref:hypothetical protein n=1 Tax=Rhizobium sp. TaxID=391 RepID=UPI002AA81ABD
MELFVDELVVSVDVLVELVLSVESDGGGPGGGPGGGLPAPDVAEVLVLSVLVVSVLSLSVEDVSSVEEAVDALLIIIASHASNCAPVSVEEDVSELLVLSVELSSVVAVVSVLSSDLLLPLSVKLSNRELSELSALVFCLVA